MYAISYMAFTGLWRPAMTAAWSLILPVLLAGARARSPAASQTVDDPAHGEFQTGGAVRSNPISFPIDGRQCVAIAAGQALFVFGLP